VSDIRPTALNIAVNESNESFAKELQVQSKTVTVHDDWNLNDKILASMQTPEGSTKGAILEWRAVDRDFNFEEKQLIRSRIKSLAVLLASERLSEIGLLTCAGFFRDEEYQARTSLERYVFFSSLLLLKHLDKC
jgi:hypothetical protein